MHILSIIGAFPQPYILNTFPKFEKKGAGCEMSQRIPEGVIFIFKHVFFNKSRTTS